MNRYRFEQLKKFASFSDLQIVKARLYNNDDEITDFAMVGFKTYYELKSACKMFDLVPMSIRIIKDSSLHNSIKTLDEDKIVIEINNRAKLGRLESSSNCYKISDEMRRSSFVVNHVDGLFYTKLTTDKNKFDSLIAKLSDLWENVMSIMTDNNTSIAGKRIKIECFNHTLEMYNNEYVSSEDWVTANMHDFQERVIEGLKIACEKEEDEVFVRYMDVMIKIVNDYINMNDSSMLVTKNHWLSECNYEVVPIKFSMVNKYSENIIYIMGAVAYGENTYL